MTTTDLPSRLLAAIAEDEQRDAHDRDCLLTDNPDDGWCDRGCCARMLQRCAALREIVELHEHQRFDFPDSSTGQRVGCIICHSTYTDFAGGWCDTIRAVARGYGLNPEETT